MEKMQAKMCLSKKNQVRERVLVAVNQLNQQCVIEETAKQKVRERVLVPVKSQEISEPRNKGSSSPLLDDFDDELCFELEEVGRELDRYKEEASKSPDLKSDPHGPALKQSTPSSNTASSTFSTPSPPLSPLPVAMYDDTVKRLSHDAHSPTRPTKVKGTEASGDSTDKNQAKAAGEAGCRNSLSDKSEDEHECRLKALNSLRFSLVVKVKMLITHKKNLSLQKDLLIENFDGDKTKLIENLLENVSQSKQINRHIQDLNQQISATNKKMVELRKLVKSDIVEKEDFDSILNDPDITETHSEVERTQHDKSDSVSACTNFNLANSIQKTPERVRKTSGNIKSPTHNKNSTNNTVPLDHEPSLPKQVKESELQDNSQNETMEKLSGQLAIHPTSKNTLWCNTCNLFFVSISSYLKHLETLEHLDKVEALGEKSLYKMFSQCAYIPEKKESVNPQEEAFGVEFLRSAKVIFCSLCECVLLAREEAASHAQSLEHTLKYKEYLLNNTGKELAFIKAKMGAFTEYCKRRKATVADKEKKEIQNKSQTKPSLNSKNNSSQVNTTGSNITEHPLTEQVTLSTSAGWNAAGAKKRTPELPALNKRLKLDAM